MQSRRMAHPSVQPHTRKRKARGWTRMLKFSRGKTMTNRTEARLQELGLVLPALPAVGGNYLPAKTVGNIVYLAGVISTNSKGVITGTVGIDRTIDEGYAPARACALPQLAWLHRHFRSLYLFQRTLTATPHL